MMRNKFLFLMILGLAFFASCSDDDDDKAQTYSGDNLTLSISGIQTAGKEAVLDGSILTVKKVLPGEAETAFNIVRKGDMVTGVNSNANREVSLSGTINGGKLGLNLTMKVKSPMMAQWDVKSLFFSVEPEPEVEPDEWDVVGFVNSLVGYMVPQLMPSITFEEDGNIVAYYCNDMEKMGDPTAYTNSPKGMALYNVIDNKIYVSLNINGIVEDVSKPKTEASMVKGRSNYNPLEALMSMVETGLPLYLREGEEGVKEVYVDREMMLPVVQMLPMLLEAYGEQLEDMGLAELVTELVEALVPLVQNSEKVELGLQLAPPAVEKNQISASEVSSMLDKAKARFRK